MNRPDVFRIYGLVDPRNHKIRYVGKTIQRISKRLWEHINDSRLHKSKKGCWIKKLESLGLKPKIKTIEICTNKKWKNREMFWIKKLKNNKLTNITIGGDSPTTPIQTAVAKIDPKTNKVIKIYPSVAKAARSEGMRSPSGIFESCSGKKCYANRFLWRRVNKKGIAVKNKNGRYRRIAKINYKTMRIIEIYTYIMKVKNKGYDPANVYAVCTGKKRSAYGFIWRYVTDNGLVNIKPTYNFKMINQFSLVGIFINRFENANQAAKQLNLKCPDLILRACRKKEGMAYGYNWKFNYF